MPNRSRSASLGRLAFNEGTRVATELASLMSAAPFLAQAPRNDGHPVLVMPGFGADDRSTTIMRGYLSYLGARARPWKLGTNLGPRTAGLRSALAARLQEIHAEHDGARVSLVGWSLGGVYARNLARLYPHMVRQVITLGSPIGRDPQSIHLPATPSTAVFSKSDSIVPWRIAAQQPSSIAENIEVYASHIGLGFNPAVFYALADRLATPHGSWRPFERSGWKRIVYGPARLEPEAGNAASRGRPAGAQGAW